MRKGQFLAVLAGGAALGSISPAAAGAAPSSVGAPSSAGAPSGADEAASLRSIYTEALVHGQAFTHLSDLVSQHPYRLAGSKNLDGAIVWATELLRSMKLDRVEDQAVMVPHWERGAPETVEIVPSVAAEPTDALGKLEPLSCTALGGCSATPPDGLTAEVVEVHSLGELTTLGQGKLSGKIVFFNRPMDPSLPNTAMAYGRAGDQRNRGPAAASKRGAVAVLTRSLTLAHDDIPHTGQTVFTPEERKIPAAALSTIAADRLDAALAANPHLRVHVAIHARTLPDAPAANVIGEIKGSEFPDQILLVGGHLDSWDIAPGAHDDGAGVVESIEVLRIFQALNLHPRHTLRCVLFVNEENGVAGATAYAAAAKTSSQRHIFAMETDNGGFRPVGFTFGNLQHNAHLRAARWQPLFRPYGVFAFDEGAPGTDVEPLLVLGIPAGELRPDSQRYFDYHHTRIDTLDKVNPRELELGAAALASILWLIDTEGL